MRTSRSGFWMTGSVTKARGQRRGVAATEMAIVLPFLCFMLVVAVDYCRIFYFTQTVQNSAYSGALYASGTVQVSSTVAKTDAAKQAAVSEGTTLTPPLRLEDVAVSFDAQNATVTVQYEYQMLTPYFGNSRVSLARSVTMGLAPIPGN
jgi:Flp pilus assembly protein TadG